MRLVVLVFLLFVRCGTPVDFVGLGYSSCVFACCLVVALIVGSLSVLCLFVVIGLWACLLLH